MKRQNERIRDLKKAIGENNNVIRSDGLDKKTTQKVSMVNNYQCTNYHVGHYCTGFHPQRIKRAVLCPLQPIPIPSTAFFKLLHKLFKAYIQTMKNAKYFYYILFN